MTPLALQQWLIDHGQPVTPDGHIGPQTRDAIRAVFVNRNARAVTDAEIDALALRLGCTTKQLRAMAKVESGGKAYDDAGRPKMLFERHLFHRFTAGRHSPTPFSQPKGGGYNEDSWAKLLAAASVDVAAAFSAASWGKFQVLGRHWRDLGYPSPIDMAWSTVTGEAAHYEMLARYIEHNGLKPALRKLSSNPEDNRALAKAYNGPSYAVFHYHTKLAAEMA